MSAFLNDLRYGVRWLRRTPGFALVAILVLALGIGANSAIFSIINAVLLRPMPYGDPGRLCEIGERSAKSGRGIPIAHREAYAARAGAFERIALHHWQNFTLTGPEGPENIYGAKLTADTFPMLGVGPALGRLFRPDEFRPGAAPAVLISDRLWLRRFGRNPAVLGKDLMMNGAAHSIVGVMPPEFFYPVRRFEAWTPWQFTAAESGNPENRFGGVARLRRGVTLEQARAQAGALFTSLSPEESKKGWRLNLTRFGEVSVQVRTTLLVLLGAVGFVLLIACLNIANLLLARALDRRAEIAVRAALGAGRLRVVRQLLTENLILAVAGGALGLALGSWGASVLTSSLPDRMPVPRVDQTRLDSAVILFTLGLSLGAAILCGILPALQASRADLAAALRPAGRGGAAVNRSKRLRGLLVVAETALSVVLLTGAGLMLRSLYNLFHVDAGFLPDRVLTLRVPPPPGVAQPKQAEYYGRILDRLRFAPGVNAVGLITPLPLGIVDGNATFSAEGRPAPPGEQRLVKFRAASPGYFRAMGIELKRGRVFEESDGAGAPGVVVVSETLARRYFPNENPIGRRVSMSSNPKPGDKWLTIVGVVRDVKYMNLADEGAPELYRDFRQFLFAPFAITIVARASAEDPERVASALQREIRSVSPDQPIVDVLPMRVVMSQSASQQRFYALLLGLFAALALSLAAAGLYGVLSYSVSRRRNEIGIRLALGASRAAIFRSVVGEAVLLAAAGVAIGLAASFALTRLIAAQLFQVKPTDAFTWLAVPAVLLLTAAAASYRPARRATRVDPAMALRCE